MPDNVRSQVRLDSRLDLSEAIKLEMLKASLNPFARRLSVAGLRTCCCLLAFPALFRPEPVPAQPANASICLTSARQVRELDPDTAVKNIPVRLTGVVTYYDPPLFNLFFQDASAGIFVLVAPDINTDIPAGQEVEVEGVGETYSRRQ